MDTPKLLDTAIAREVAAYRLYEALADEATSPDVKTLLTHLAGQEREHERLLQDLEPDAVAAFVPEHRPDAQLTEYLREAPEAPTGNLQDALTYAMQRELEARDAYRRMADLAADATTKALLEKLSVMENTHKAKLEELYEDIFMREA